jgi:citrate synthase
MAFLYTSVVGGICAFKGPLHERASEAVPAMYDEILKSGGDVQAYVVGKVAAKERLAGFGHRVYRCWDPRAKYMFDVLSNDGLAYRSVSEYLSVAIAPVNVTADHEFFRDRRIFPNPDLFNGIFLNG